MVKFATISSGIIPLFELLIKAGICPSDTCFALPLAVAPDRL